MNLELFLQIQNSFPPLGQQNLSYPLPLNSRNHSDPHVLNSRFLKPIIERNLKAFHVIEGSSVAILDGRAEGQICAEIHSENAKISLSKVISLSLQDHLIRIHLVSLPG